MPTLYHHTSQSTVKLLLFGNSKTGKTGSLASLVAAGYYLRILDFDNLLGILRTKVLEICPDKISTAQWLEVHETAHAVGLRSNNTIMFGHVDGPRSWACHLIAVRDLQRLVHVLLDQQDGDAAGADGADQAE